MSKIYCPQANKQKMQFETKKKAELFLKYNEGLHQYPYYCAACCCYHLTKQEVTLKIQAINNIRTYKDISKFNKHIKEHPNKKLINVIKIY